MHLAIPPELTIAHVGALHNLWMPLILSSADDVDVFGGEVTDIDGAGLQLLMATARAVAVRSQAFSISEPSEVLMAAMSTIGWQLSASAN